MSNIINKCVMMIKNAKGITWIGNMYQKFENMFLELDDTMFEETVQYMQTVGESVKRFYSDVMDELLPPPSVGIVADAELSNNKGSMKITAEVHIKKSTEDSSINRDSANSIKEKKLFSPAKQFVFKRRTARPHVKSEDAKSKIGSDENQQKKNMPASEITTDVTLSKPDTCGSSKPCEISNENQNHEAIVSKEASAEVTTFASVAEPAEEKEINMSSVSSDIFEHANGFSVINVMQPEDCSHSTVIVSDPENIDAAIEQDHETTPQDDELKLDETCVMITKDELEIVSDAQVNMKTNEEKWLQPFSLSKSTRKQEYEELALLHGNIENGNDDCMDSLATDSSEPEWELLYFAP